MKPTCSHGENLRTALALSRYMIPGTISPIAIAKILNSHGLPFVLIGSYGIAGWLRKPRATQDVDLIVRTVHRKKAVTALLAAFRHLVSMEDEFFIRLRSRKYRHVAIDLLKTIEPLYKVVFRFATEVSIGRHRIRLPTLELALAMKFSALMSPRREYAAQYLDAHDFIRMARISPDIDLATLYRLGELAYAGGGTVIREKVRGIRAGEKFIL
jgi:hypothetical protein